MSEQRISMTWTAFFWVGFALLLIGATAAVLGLGGATVFTVAFGDRTVDTTSVGLAVLAIGAIVTLAAAALKPKDVAIASEYDPSLADRLTERPWRMVYLFLAIAGLALAVWLTLRA